jgi:hypothetical protein
MGTKMFLKASAVQALMEYCVAVHAGLGTENPADDKGLACIVLYNMIYALLMKDKITSIQLKKLDDLIHQYVPLSFFSLRFLSCCCSNTPTGSSFT